MATAALALLGPILSWDPSRWVGYLEALEELLGNLPVPELADFLRGAVGRLSFASCVALPARPLAGRAPTEAEDRAVGTAMVAVDCCSRLANILLPHLKSPAVCEALGSSAAYRLVAACSWACGEEAAAVLRGGLDLGQALGYAVDGEALAMLTTRTLQTACLVAESGPSKPAGGPPPHAKAMLATLCQPARLLHLLDAAAEVLLAADKASGAAARLAVLWAARPPGAAAEQEAVGWLHDWLRPLHIAPWDCCGVSLEQHEQTQLLARLNDAAAWLLRQHRRGCGAVWSGLLPRRPGPIIAMCSTLCQLARSLVEPGPCSPAGLLLAAEASGLPAASLLATLEREAADGSSGVQRPAGLPPCLALLRQLYQGLSELCHVEDKAAGQQSMPLDLGSVPEGAESLLGAAEAALRLAALLAQLLPPPASRGRVMTGEGQMTAIGKAGNCFVAAVDAAEGLIGCAGAQLSKNSASWTDGTMTAVQHCAVSAAKLARAAVALLGQHHAAAAAAVEAGADPSGGVKLGCKVMMLLRRVALYPQHEAGSDGADPAEVERHYGVVLWAVMDGVQSVLRLEAPAGVFYGAIWNSIGEHFIGILGSSVRGCTEGTRPLLRGCGAELLAVKLCLEAVRSSPVVEEALGPAACFEIADCVFSLIELVLTTFALVSSGSLVATCISSGLVRELAAWGERAAQASKGSVKGLHALEVLRGKLARVLKTASEAAALLPADDGSQALARLHDQLQGLSKKQLRSRAVWQQLQQGMEGPVTACAARVAAAEQGRQRALQLRVAQMLALRPSANPACTNMRGASEARLRGQRCSGCRMARFCSSECQAAAWPQHALVCAALRQQGA